MGQGGKGPKKQRIRDAVRFPERSIPAAETGVSVGAEGGWAVPSQEGLVGTDGAEVTVCPQRARQTRVGGLGGQEPSPGFSSLSERFPHSQ